MKFEMMLAWYPVENLDAARRFYGEILGLRKVFEMPGWAEYAHAEKATPIGVAEQPQASRGAVVVLKVDDIDQARAELTRQGIQFDGPTQDIPGVVRLALFRDPSGNALQLAQPMVK